MKALREFSYLAKNASTADAIFYLFYKVSLKVRNFSGFKIYRERRTIWLNKIYGYLYLLNNNRELVNGKELIVLKGVNNNFSKIYLRPFSSDFQVYSQVILQKSYQPVIEIYKQVFRLPPNNFIDLGANIGLTSVFFENQYKDLNIIAIEPFKENIEMAELNMKSSNVKNYAIIFGGIWNKKTKLSVSRNFRDGKEWSINLVENSDGEIPGFCLEELLNQFPFADIVKIDIEGAEKNLFEDDAYAARFLKRIKCLALEIHDEFNCRDIIYGTLNRNNFFFYNIKDMTVALNRTFI